MESHQENNLIEAIEAIKNDAEIKSLVSELNKLTNNISISYILSENGELTKQIFSDWYVEHVKRVKDLIDFRKNQILSAYNINPNRNEN